MDYNKLIFLVFIGVFFIHTLTPYPDKFTIYPNIDKYYKNK